MIKKLIVDEKHQLYLAISNVRKSKMQQSRKQANKPAR